MVSKSKKEDDRNCFFSEELYSHVGSPAVSATDGRITQVQEWMNRIKILTLFAKSVTET